MTTIHFDELNLHVDGVYFGSITGQAEVMSDGTVTEIAVKGWDSFDVNAKLKWRVFSRPSPLETPMTFRDIIGRHLLREFERQYAGAIRDQLDDERADMASTTRDLGPSQHQRL